MSDATNKIPRTIIADASQSVAGGVSYALFSFVFAAAIFVVISLLNRPLSVGFRIDRPETGAEPQWVELDVCFVPKADNKCPAHD